jgi:Mor family transcriptional regulator
LADCIGLEAALKLMVRYGGGEPYIPGIDRSLLRARNDEIREEYTGENAYRLSRKYGLSTRSIRKITQGIRRQRQIDGQLNLFDIKGTE